MFSCMICNDTNFTSRQLFYKHLIDHKLKQGCTKCDTIILTKKRRPHMRQHDFLICPICDTEVERLNHEEHLKVHEYLYSVDQLNCIVDIINQIQGSENPSGTTDDILKYQGDQPNCPVKNCNKHFKTQNDLINHFIEHRTRHLCKFCNEIFPNDAEFSTHSDNKICRAYSCHNCGKYFSFEKFIRHIISECENKNLFDNMVDVEPIETHNQRKIYRVQDEINYCLACFVCEDEFPNMNLLNEHLETHNKKLNVCAKCFCVFNEEQELQDHTANGCEEPEELPENIRKLLKSDVDEFVENFTKRRAHLDVNKKVYKMFGDSVMFQCNFCSSKFVKFSYLKQHCEKLKHELIFCYKCFYLFNTWGEFRKHYCLKLDYNDINELQFREEFKKCLKRKCQTQNETPAEIKQIVSEDFRLLSKRDDDLLGRMSNMIEQLENTKFTDINVTKIFKETPSTSTSSSTEVVKNRNDDYDLNKILPRILERRNKRLFCKPKSDEDSEEELEKIETNLQELNIGKKHLLIKNNEYELDTVLPRVIKLRNKRHLDDDINDIDKFLLDLGSPQNEDTEPLNENTESRNDNAEPPNKKNKSLSYDSEDTSDYLIKMETFIDSRDESEEDEKPNKISKY